MKMLQKKWLLAALAIPFVAAGLGAAGFASLRAKPAPAGQGLPLADAERILLAAAREGDAEVVAGLLKAGVSAEVRDARGYTPLILAAYHGHPATVAALLERGADHGRANDRGQTALAAAVFRQSTQTARVLLGAGADPDAGSQSARLTARFFDLPEMTALLDTPEVGSR